MCYICGKSSGHEAGCPFSVTKTKYLKCRECGEEVAEHEAYDCDEETCFCWECFFKETD